MAVKTYLARPVAVQAVQWRGTNTDEVRKFIRESGYDATVRPASTIQVEALHAIVRFSVGDWIVEGVQGGLFPLRPDVFEAAYEPLSSHVLDLSRGVRPGRRETVDDS